MAAAQADPEMIKVVGPYQAMLALPSSLDAVQARARDIYASGWHPPKPPGPTRDELADLVTAAADTHGHPAKDAALSAATAPGPAMTEPPRQTRVYPPFGAAMAVCDRVAVMFKIWLTCPWIRVRPAK
jgi:hypothetical protein